jgi:hypothetical protein
MSHPCLWDVACAFDLIVLAGLDVDTMYRIRDWFSRLDLASCISDVDTNMRCDSPSKDVDFLINDRDTVGRS